MRKNALSEHQAPLGGPEGRNAGKAREFHEIIAIILYKTISYNTISNPKSYSFESDKVELIGVNKIDMATGFRYEHKLWLIVSVLNPDDVISGNALDVLENLQFTFALLR